MKNCKKLQKSNLTKSNLRKIAFSQTAVLVKSEKMGVFFKSKIFILGPISYVILRFELTSIVLAASCWSP